MIITSGSISPNPKSKNPQTKAQETSYKLLPIYTKCRLDMCFGHPLSGTGSLSSRDMGQVSRKQQILSGLLKLLFLARNKQKVTKGDLFSSNGKNYSWGGHQALSVVLCSWLKHWLCSDLNISMGRTLIFKITLLLRLIKSWEEVVLNALATEEKLFEATSCFWETEACWSRSLLELNKPSSFLQQELVQARPSRHRCRRGKK